ncbi:unnamed protein product, partial [Prorocentrum cordatum]
RGGVGGGRGGTGGPPGRPAARRVPSRDAEAIAMRYQGELVFARSQSFDQWVRLAGEEEGWMLAATEDMGELLLPLHGLPHLDLWLLCDLWRSARASAAKGELDQKAQSDLKDAEARARLAAVAAFERLQFDEEACSWRVSEACPEQEDPVALGLLAREDLQVGEAGMARIVRHIFSRQLPRFCSDEPGLRRLVPELRRSGGSVPLPVDGGDEDEAPEGAESPLGPTVLLEHDGRMYLAAQGGLLFDPADPQKLVGVWDPAGKTVEAPPEGFDVSQGVTMLEHEGQGYVMTGDGSIFDPAARVKVGTFDPESKSVRLLADAGCGVQLRMARDGPLEAAASAPALGGDAAAGSPGAADAAGAETGVQELLAQAARYTDRKLYRLAAREYGKALESCAAAGCVELDEEADILRRRAECFAELKEHQKLLDDAERLLGYDSADPRALEWRRASAEELEKRRALRGR